MARALVVTRIFMLIGLLTAAWRASGTIPFFVYYGISVINPRFFILFAFLLTCGVSSLLGSSLGTTGTIGLVLMVLARSGGVDVNVTAGAILAGAYWGDRCAPTSSSANLVAAITGTSLYPNIRNMLRSSLIPVLLSSFVYLYLSAQNPISGVKGDILSEISLTYNLGIITALPALLILLFSLAGRPVRLSLTAGILSALLIAVMVQKMPWSEVLISLLRGYRPVAEAGTFKHIIAGGGLLSMLTTIFIVLVASGYAGIFEGAGLLAGALVVLKRWSWRLGVYPTTLGTSIFASAFGCNQTLAVILTHQLVEPIYRERRIVSPILALDLEDTAIVTAALVPWNIAAAVPLAMLSVGPACLPYAVFLYMLPLYRLICPLPANLTKTPGAEIE